MTVADLIRKLATLPPNATMHLPDGTVVEGVFFGPRVRDKQSKTWITADPNEARIQEAAGKVEVINVAVLDSTPPTPPTHEAAHAEG